MTCYIDIDGTICRTTNADYENAQPWTHCIKVVNWLYASGHIIVIWTARGGSTPNDKERCKRLHDLTVQQLQKWGVKYHHLRMDKPEFDILVDDKTIDSLIEFQLKLCGNPSRY